jgi:hypothetical protein
MDGWLAGSLFLLLSPIHAKNSFQQRKHLNSIGKPLSKTLCRTHNFRPLSFILLSRFDLRRQHRW